ncbi:RadC family protein [Serratia marcescens]|uniref:RadC family protein n=1 Tax=Serratia marcescens TaxID=615 RepID=UPI001BAE8D2F|nr:DNA repair protein RadC [Serratia marcescens]MBS3892784.1 DNA repair protein RadC [Serratia marcescens]
MNITTCPSGSGEISSTAQRTIRRALILLERQLREPGAAFTSSQAVRDWLRLQLATLEREVFMALFLDNQHRLIAHETLFTGTINHTQVHPREVVKAGLKHNCAAVIVAHCHPSGLAEPSLADRQVTTRIQQALDLVDIRLLDHLVVGGMEIVSFSERGWL